MTKHRIYSVSVASVYPLYIAKAEKKGRTTRRVTKGSNPMPPRASDLATRPPAVAGAFL